MEKDTIILTHKDYERLKDLINQRDIRYNGGAENMANLLMEMERALKVESEKVPPDVVTMNTLLEFTDLENNITKQLKLVYPQKADIKKGNVSVFAPIGTAILGYRKGDIIEWKVPAGKKKFKISNIIYQPEANGDYQA
jgi:regulator of nucleoside diphosphate kinase